MAGRYDKIEVHTASGKKTPRQIFVFHDGQLRSLGTHTDVSVNTHLYIMHNGRRVDILKHPVLHQSEGEWKPCNTVFVADPRNGYCFCPSGSSSAGLGSIVNVTGVGTASSNGTGAKTGRFVNRNMKVIVKLSNAKNPYGLNKYGSGTINNWRDITAWFPTSAINGVSELSASRAECYFQGFIQKDTDDDVTIFESFTPDGKYWRAIWLSNGHIQISINNGQGSDSMLSLRSIGKDKLCWFDTYIGKDGTNAELSFCTVEEYNNGQSYAEGNVSYQALGKYSWADAAADHYLGDRYGLFNLGGSRMRFRYMVLWGGSMFNSGQQRCQLNGEYRLNEGNYSTNTYELTVGGPSNYGVHNLDLVQTVAPESYYSWE